MIFVMFVIFLFFNQFYQLNAIKQSVNQSGLNRDLRRFKRSDLLKSGRPNGGGVRSCYCKLRSSFPATINEEKLDFVCNCRRSSNYETLLFKQHKHSSSILDDDNYLPNSSTRSASRSRSKYYKSKQRHRDLKNFRFEFEKRRKKQKRKQRRPNSISGLSTISNDGLMQFANESFEDQQPEPNPNETNLSEQSHEMCTCTSRDGCKGNCDLLNGCVCSNEKTNECWGSSCFKTKINVPFFNLQDHHLLKNEPQSFSELANLIYFANKNKLNRLKMKNVNHLFGNRLPDQAESSIMSRINLDYPSSILNPVHPVGLFSPVPSISFTRAASQQTIRSIILSELESTEQTKNGQCRCLHGRCFGLECENLKGCICDEIGCYGKFCSLFKTPYTDHQENLLKNKQNIITAEQLHEYELVNRPASRPSFKYNYQIDDKPTTDDPIKQSEYAKESSKTIKCEKVAEETSDQKNDQNKIRQQHPAILSATTNNKSQLIKNTNLKDTDKDSLNAYQMKVIKLTPVSSSQLVEEGSNRDQSRIQSETISLML